MIARRLHRRLFLSQIPDDITVISATSRSSAESVKQLKQRKRGILGVNGKKRREKLKERRLTEEQVRWRVWVVEACTPQRLPRVFLRLVSTHNTLGIPYTQHARLLPVPHAPVSRHLGASGGRDRRTVHRLHRPGQPVRRHRPWRGRNRTQALLQESLQRLLIPHPSHLRRGLHHARLRVQRRRKASHLGAHHRFQARRPQARPHPSHD